MTPAVGVVLVTHNSVAWIDRVWNSITSQDHPLVHVVVIDDESTDGTRSRVAALSAACSDQNIAFDLVSSTTTARDATTRIAQNFCQGVLRLRHLNAVALGCASACAMGDPALRCHWEREHGGPTPAVR